LDFLISAILFFCFIVLFVSSKFKDQLYFQKGITQDQDIFRVVINREEVENIFPSFKNSHLIKKRFMPFWKYNWSLNLLAARLNIL
jgi:sugar-specific transcriptional regulator TrmB